jgi:predicted DsbA family dithiol-disulfide isomerase
MKQNYLFMEFGCPYCEMYLNEIDKVNSKLSPKDKVKIIDVTNASSMEILDNFLIEKLSLSSVPVFFIDGYQINGVSSKEWIQGFLNSVFKEEFVI